MSRLSRQEIKRDEMMETVGSVVKYTRSHSRSLLAIVLGVILLAVLLAGGYSWLKSRQMLANEKLVQALGALETDFAAEQADPFADAARRGRARELFETLVDDHPRSGAANVARAYLAEIAVREGDLERAAGLWEEVAEAGNHMLAAQARVNLLTLARQQGRGEELVERLREMLVARRPPLPEDAILYQLGLTLEDLGRTDEARDSFQRLVDEYPASPYAIDARGRSERPGGAPAGVLGG